MLIERASRDRGQEDRLDRSLDRRAALERRIWRLAWLLTGDEAIANDLIGEVLKVLKKRSPHLVDRLVVLRSRERRPDADPFEIDGLSNEGAKLFASLLRLPSQQREAWILTELDELDAVVVSRTMDCSRKAMERHLQAASARIEDEVPNVASSLAALRSFTDGLDPAPIVEAWRASRRRRVKIRIVAGLVVVVVLAIVVWVVL